MFDTRETGRKIAALRKEHNMTQYELADRLGISFQAVSNWERGNSMPDIAKLPEIAELFETTIDEILGKSNPVLNQVAKGETTKAIQHTIGLAEGMQILSEAAPLLKPSQITEMAKIDVPRDSIAPLLPFMDEEDLTELFEKYEAEGRSTSFFYPFLPKETIKELVHRYLSQGTSIAPLLPFMEEEDMEEILEQYEAEGRPTSPFYPFLSEEKLAELCNRYKAEGKPITPFLPFLGDEELRTLAEEAFSLGGTASLSPFLPFLSEEDIKAFAERILKN